ncbi:MAG: DNA primase DnaG [Candidatus Woesearchaeota archaeon]|nr:DNA primase DnaG [Candidatus Woesearchaeota archaeon]
MGKISPVSAKYIVHTNIQIDGVVDRPDVIGAIFGQTEGLLGNDLELRELQRNGRIGRIEVNLDTRTGKTNGVIIIPSSLDKAETVIIGAALETIQRIGPCNAKLRVEKVEDVRVSKRNYVIERAKELLKELTDNVLPDSQEITDEVAQSVRMMEITEYGKDRLPAGPAVDESEEIIVVEGRADVLNLLKNGIKNVIALNGTNVPETIIELSRRKILTVFVDGDRGGDLIIKELTNVAEIDYVIKAPDGKEVEEITKKEIFKALRSKVAVEQVKMEINGRPHVVQEDIREKIMPKKVSKLQKKDGEIFKKMLDDLVGTRGAYILDENSNILGKVPTSEIVPTIRNLTSGVWAIVFDGIISKDVVMAAEKSNVNYLIAMNSKVRPNETRIELLTESDL